MTKLTKVAQPQEMTLTAEEASLVMLFRAMDRRHKDQNLAIMGQQSKIYPVRTPPALRLLTGGAA